ncbi:hypothetical protein AB833_07940 [Chromatiales bacterium (ex Bugula neritina AB1)]|nr:hypothetical protein AB833_07940 [Chromatiales bacterium (ex Bugula neritina AB1)]
MTTETRDTLIQLILADQAAYRALTRLPPASRIQPGTIVRCEELQERLKKNRQALAVLFESHPELCQANERKAA